MLPRAFCDTLFDDFFNEPFPKMPFPYAHNPLYGKHEKNLMKTDVREKEDTYEVDVDLPGFTKDEVHLDLHDGTLTITAAKRLDKDDKDDKGTYIRRERYTGALSRSFYVGEEIKPTDVKAKFENGILELTLPKEARKQLPTETAIAIE